MAAVYLKFTAPERAGFVTLEIYEATDPNGIGTLIETVNAPDIGTFPNYITSYETTLATSPANYFAIKWIDDAGAATQLSPYVQGNKMTAVGQVVDRVMQRDPSLDRAVVVHEAEAAIELMTNQDPYSADLTLTYSQLMGLTLLILANSYLITSAQSGTTDVSQATIGLVSFKTSSGTSSSTRTVDVQALLDMAARFFGTSGSFVLQMGDCYVPEEWAQIYQP